MSKAPWISKGRTRIDAFKKSTELRLETGFRSTLEVGIADQLDEAGISYTYEREKLSYIVPERKATYLPDFVIEKGDKKIYIEGKGWPFEADDRQKMRLVKNQHPDKDIRIVFLNTNQKIGGPSKTTVGQWAEKNGFQYSDKGVVPATWLEEVM